MENIINKFSVFTEKPVKFLTVQNDVGDDIKTLVKSLYDYTKTQEKVGKKGKKSALPELIVQDFDEEQIWQEIELQNSECWDQLVWEVANCMSHKNDLVFPVKTEESKKVQLEDSNENTDGMSMENEIHSDDAVCEKLTKTKKDKYQKVTKKTKTSIVDDKFFKLQEMEQFLLKEEKTEGKVAKADSDEESIDMFEDIDDEDVDDNENQVMYNEFFDPADGENGFDETGDMEDSQENDYSEGSNDENDELHYDDFQKDDNNGIIEDNNNVNDKKKDKKVRFAQDSSSDDEDSEIGLGPTKTVDEKKSEFELRQQRLKQHIERLEQKTLKEAPWQLKGEVDANKRPQNSLLQEVVDFDLTSRPPPIITEETTLTLEDIIKQRVKDKAWDDVVKKEKPVEDQLSFRKKEIIDQSKSKLSLAQVYEAEYLKQKHALSGEDQEEKEPEAHVEIRDTISKLFAKLDALCHYHYTPKPAQAEVKIVTNTPAISMEEVAPLATSDATLLAPEEVKKKHRGDLIAKEERSQTDKNRERRKKKKLQREKGTVNKVTEQRNTKKGNDADNKSLKTSKAFFQQLNDDSTSLLKNKSKRNVINKGQ